MIMIENLKGAKMVALTSTKASKTKEKTMEEPKDSAVITSKKETNPTQELSDREITALKKDMEEKGFVLNDKGLAPAIIYPSGETKLIEGQQVVSKCLGEVTATLWQVEAFTANISPEAYQFFSKNESHYTIMPDIESTCLKKPKMKFGLIALCDSLDNMQ